MILVFWKRRFKSKTTRCRLVWSASRRRWGSGEADFTRWCTKGGSTKWMERRTESAQYFMLTCFWFDHKETYTFPSCSIQDEWRSEAWAASWWNLLESWQFSLPALFPRREEKLLKETWQGAVRLFYGAFGKLLLHLLRDNFVAFWFISRGSAWEAFPLHWKYRW